MFLLFAKKFSAETSLTPAQCKRKLRCDLISYTRRPSLIAVNGFIKTHRSESCFYGDLDKNGRVEIFFHRAKKHDGASAGFFGKIEKTEHGSRISGKLKRTAAVGIAAAVWCILLILLILTLISLKIYDGAACTAVLFAVGAALIAYDGSENALKSYLDSFPKPDSGDNADKTDAIYNKKE